MPVIVERGLNNHYWDSIDLFFRRGRSPSRKNIITYEAEGRIKVMNFAKRAQASLCNIINWVKVMIIQAKIYNHRHIIGFITRRQALIFVGFYPCDKFVCYFLSTQLRFFTSLLEFFGVSSNQAAAWMWLDSIWIKLEQQLNLLKVRKEFDFDSFNLFSVTRKKNLKIAKHSKEF